MGGIQRGQHETVHRFTGPRGILHERRLSTAHRLEAPPVETLLKLHRPSVVRREIRDLCLRHSRIRRSLAHPLSEQFDLSQRQHLFRRHFEIFFRVAHRLDQQARTRLAGHDGRPALTAFLPS